MKQLGVDPDSVTVEDDAKFNAEIAETTGQNPEAFKERQKKMEKLGKAAKAFSD